ncbi:LCP family protein [Alkalihalophilus sp. As8PL]|uniref:LCP family protein n=1 Tax=Alkalihalophilus sp. As8PL TaxID=3237103 RepID=A0AB39BQ16_9BACI
MHNSRLKYRKKRRSRRILKAFLGIGLIAFFLFGAGVAYFIYQLSSVTASNEVELARGDKSEKRIEAVNPSKDNFSVLLLGDDSRPGETRARTDAMMVATFNKDDSSIFLTSIPRDSRVEIVGRGTLDKINHAHAFGGLDMTVDTVENLLDIPIDYYGIVKFEGLVQVVDALGGIQVDSPFAFDFKESSTNLDVSFVEGPQTINGDQALAYTRLRKHPQANGDIGRGQRQQQVIEGIIKKSASFSSITRFDDVFQAIGDNLQTNLTFSNILALHSYAGSIDNIETLQLQGSDMRLDGIYYYDLDPYALTDVQIRLKQHLEIDGYELPEGYYDRNNYSENIDGQQEETKTNY